MRSEPLARYAPGDGVAVVVGSTAVLIPGSPEDPLAAACLDALLAGGIDEVVDVLFARGLRSAPDFVLVEVGETGGLTSGHARALARGRGQVEIWSAEGMTLLDHGRLVAECEVTGATGAVLRFGTASGVASVRIGAGIVAADSVTVGVVGPVATAVGGFVAQEAVAEEATAIEAVVVQEPELAAVPPVAEEDVPVAADEAPRFLEPVPVWAPPEWPEPGLTSNGATTSQAVDPFAVAPVAAYPPPPGAAALQGPDPDGDMEMTIARGDLDAVLPAEHQPGGEGPLVLAKTCLNGHHTVAFQPACRVCGGPVPDQQPREIHRPPLGILRLESGEAITLDRDVVLGRAPRVPEDHVGETPHLVRVVDANREISGQHALVAVNYWVVNLTDLGSTNGTEVIDRDGVRTSVTRNQPVGIEPGCTLVLGGVTHVAFEATP